MMTLNKPVKILSVSDVHTGSKRNKTSKIIKNLEKSIFDDPDNKDLDIIAIVGDFFDSLLDLNSPDVPIIDFFIYKLLNFCSVNKIKLRILEGTPSHDWTQSERFLTLSKMLKLTDLDILYVDNVFIEYMEDYNFHILYVPDEIQPTPEKTLALVKECMLAKSITTVDLAFMHGQFEYQLPSHIKGIPRHSSDEYMKIVDKLIFIGHIHTHSTFGKIVAQGSFDRLSHGEEEPKGFVRADVYSDKCDIFFIENKNAKIYKTIKCLSDDLEDTFKLIKDTIKGLPEDSAIRISAISKHPIFANMQELVIMAPHITWTKHIRDKDNKDDKISELIQDEAEYIPITLSKDNLHDLLMNRLVVKLDNEHLLISRMSEMIKDVL